MSRFATAALTVGLLVSTANSAVAQDAGEFRRSTYHDFRIVTVAEGLVNPWSMTFLPNGDMLVTERPGRLRIVRDGELMAASVEGLPEIYVRGQGGLLDVVVHPDFRRNSMLYISYSKPGEEGGSSTTAIIRARFENDALHDVEELFVANSAGRGHYGSRIIFDGQGHIFFSVGDRQASTNADLPTHPAQDRSNHHGTINRLMEDGTIPPDNPFIGTAGVEPSIYSYGHRNPQGLIFIPETGDIWATEHGPQGGDEFNRILPGLNYGWPVVGFGVNYGSGTTIHEGTMREDVEPPAHFWVPSIATSGLMHYTGERFPAWHGNVFVGGLAGEQMARLTLDGDVVVSEETLLQGLGRVRDIRQGPDGFIYVALEDRSGEPSALVRLEPAN
ncbi:MAG: PQQ-dependent sugar dehydrogenase [Longimicrobiales bacterium]|nr:PQQ-dependent sugar dehydrogenase [Longimicrobiales bacterium]